MSFFSRRPSSPKKPPIIRDLRPYKWLLMVIGPIFSLVVASLESLTTTERIGLFLVQALAIILTVYYLPDEAHEGNSDISNSLPTPSRSYWGRSSSPLPPSSPSSSPSNSPFRRGADAPFGRLGSRPLADDGNDSSPFRRFSRPPSSNSDENTPPRPSAFFRRRDEPSNGDMGSAFKRYFEEESEDEDTNEDGTA